MASTPSASALSAVLRSQGTLLSRNPPSKRPSSSSSAAYSLGLAGGALREPPAERGREPSSSSPVWEALVSVGRLATVTLRWDRGAAPRTNERLTRKVSQRSGYAHSAGCAGSAPPTARKGRRITTVGAKNRHATFIRDFTELRGGSLSVTVTSPAGVAGSREVSIRGAAVTGWWSWLCAHVSTVVMAQLIAWSAGRNGAEEKMQPNVSSEEEEERPD